MKIIGIIIAWACEDWITLAIRQAKELCDEVFVIISPHSKELENFRDNTYNIAKSFNNIRLYDLLNDVDNHSAAKASLLNAVLERSKYFKENNWIWILDADEFYTEDTREVMEEMINENQDVDQIDFTARFFYINMQHYLVGTHPRLFRIKKENIEKENYRFLPTQYWSGTELTAVACTFHMFHYSLLTNPFMRKHFWKTEYSGTEQSNKTLWLDKIYKNFNLDNQSYWIKKNKKLFDIKSPWFSDSFVGKEKSGYLYKYDGKHPKIIEESGLTAIKDFRKKYNFCRGFYEETNSYTK